MNIWRSNQQDQIDPSSPITGIRGQDLEDNQQRQAPKLRDNPNQEPLVEPLRYPRTEQQVDNENDIRRDSQQIGFESAKAHALQLDSDVVCRWRVGNHPDQTQEVNRPHVVVAQRVPEHLGGDSLAIVHASLAGVVAEHTVDHDLFLVLVEPAVLATEPAFGLCRGCGHPKHRDDSDHAGDEAFESKEIAPAASAVAVVHMQEAISEECANDRGDLVRDPEVTQSHGQFGRFIPKRKEQDRIGNTVQSQRSSHPNPNGSLTIHPQSDQAELDRQSIHCDPGGNTGKQPPDST